MTHKRCLWSVYFQAAFSKSALLGHALLFPGGGEGRTGIVGFQLHVDLSLPRHEKAQHSFLFLKIGFI